MMRKRKSKRPQEKVYEANSDDVIDEMKCYRRRLSRNI